MPSQLYTFSELLGQAETIVLAESGAATPPGMRLRVLEWLKGPPADVKDWTDPALLRRAQALLEEEARAAAGEAKAGAAPAVPPPVEPGLPLWVASPQGAPLPRAGAQALYFLWDRQAATPEAPLRYVLSHPQCVYDAGLAAEVKSELARPRAAPRRAYLREWDRRQAQRLTQRKENEQLRQLACGNVDKGMRLVIRSAGPSLRAPGGFDVLLAVENSRDAPQAIYDGPAGGFGVRLRQKDAPLAEALVVRHTDPEVTGGVDQQVLLRLGPDDFAAVPRSGAWSKRLHFEPLSQPELAGLSGEYVLSAFYSSAQDGRGLGELPGVPWTGMLASQEVPLRLGPAATGVEGRR